MGYDYVIVGDGSADCTLAARLNEDRQVKVLLLEPGGSDWNPLLHWPASFAKMTKGIAGSRKRLPT
jgi:choline dehydrogenase-like flavoprotein